jgi:hypothetical protein
MRALPAGPENAQKQGKAAEDLADPANYRAHALKTMPAGQLAAW